ncbi:MAG: DNA polymerase III subunit beta [Bacillota bacterium]
MEFNCNKDDLAYAVQLVGRAVSTKNTLPLINGIMLLANNNRLTIRATDLEIAIEYSLDTEIADNGTVVVPGKYFSEMVKRLPSGMINIKSNDNQGLDIRYNQSEVSINGYPAEEFPLFPETESSVSGYINQDLFKKIVKQISVASSNDLTRPVFTGILMEILENTVTFVATDTHRLALRQGIWQGDAVNEKISIIIPNRTMVEIARIISDEPEPLHISLNKNQVLFTTGDFSFTSRLIEGQYPNYQAVIPDRDKCISKIIVQSKRLLESAERASLLIREDMNEKFSLIKFNAENNVLKISSNSPEIGKIYEEINIFLDGDPMEIVFNSKYLIDALRTVNSEDIEFEFNGPLSPGIIKAVQNEEYLYLILPVRTT